MKKTKKIGKPINMESPKASSTQEETATSWFDNDTESLSNKIQLFLLKTATAVWIALTALLLWTILICGFAVLHNIGFYPSARHALTAEAATFLLFSIVFSSSLFGSRRRMAWVWLGALCLISILFSGLPESTEARNNVVLLFSGVFALSLFLNKKLMIIVWLIAFHQLFPIFLGIPELKRVHDSEACLDEPYKCMGEEPSQ